MIASGVYPAAVSPLDPKGKLDFESLAKLLAWYESAGCQGAVLAGTNGEGPSLSAVEKRDLIVEGVKLKGKLHLILGIATPSLDEAVWLSRRAAEAGAVATLLMPPGYFREASEEGIYEWFLHVLDRSPIPAIIYNFPKRTGVILSSGLMERLSRHSNMAGLKDSSGEEANLDSYRTALPDGKVLFVGDETLLIRSLEAGWTGSISGAANVVPHWLSTIVREWMNGEKKSAEEKFKILSPVLEAVRKAPQPATNKAVLKLYHVIQNEAPRLPLESCPPEIASEIADAIQRQTGFR